MEYYIRKSSYPFYFIIDLDTITRAAGGLMDLEAVLAGIGIYKNIVNTRSWPKIPDSHGAEDIWKALSTLR